MQRRGRCDRPHDAESCRSLWTQNSERGIRFRKQLDDYVKVVEKNNMQEPSREQLLDAGVLPNWNVKKQKNKDHSEADVLWREQWQTWRGDKKPKQSEVGWQASQQRRRTCCHRRRRRHATPPCHRQRRAAAVPPHACHTSRTRGVVAPGRIRRRRRRRAPGLPGTQHNLSRCVTHQRPHAPPRVADRALQGLLGQCRWSKRRRGSAGSWLELRRLPQ